MSRERVGISEASLIVGIGERSMRDLAALGRIPGVEKIDRKWTFDEELLRGWVAGTVAEAQDTAHARALNREFPCPDYMRLMVLWPDLPNRIYFIQAASGHIKIGLAFKPASRMRELQVAHALPLKLLAEMSGGRQHEMYLHEFYAKERVRGEWFEPSERLLAYVERLSR